MLLNKGGCGSYESPPPLNIPKNKMIMNFYMICRDLTCKRVKAKMEDFILSHLK